MILSRTLVIFRCKSLVSEVIKMSNNGIATSCKMYEKALEDLRSNPFYEKYASKIAKLQQESPEEFNEKIEIQEKSKQKKAVITEVNERSYSVASENAKPQLKCSPYAKPKKLDEVMKTELLVDKTDEEIKRLWLDYHRNKNVVVGVVPKNTYSLMYERGMQFSTFLFPIPRSQGYEFILCQFVAHEVHFTPLIAYQAHKENAPECLTVTFYPDLQEEKGIVLMKGDFDTNILNCHEAQCLINELQLYYAQHNEKRLKLLKRFTYEPEKFNHMDLISDIECLSL